MAVYKRSYHGYSGQLTPEWTRFLILSRQAWRSLFRGRLMTGFFVICCIPFLVAAVLIYLNHSGSILSLFRVQSNEVIDVNAKFFFQFLNIQVGFAFLLAAFAGPGLIAPDLANNGLVLYFCRPFTRAEYVSGKLLVIAGLLSAISWIPDLLLFILQSSLAGWSWFWANLYIAGAIVLGSWVMILSLSLLALALSAWVKWKPVAGALVLGVLFLGSGFGAAIDAIMRTNNGFLISIPMQLESIWRSLFRLEEMAFRPQYAWLGLVAISSLCLYLLARKLRAYEVVR